MELSTFACAVLESNLGKQWSRLDATGSFGGCVGSANEPIQIPLTREQQEIIRRLSGRHAQVLEITPNSTDSSEGDGRSLQFRWRLSSATGIPRQVWAGDEEDAEPSKSDEGSTES